MKVDWSIFFCCEWINHKHIIIIYQLFIFFANVIYNKEEAYIVMKKMKFFFDKCALSPSSSLYTKWRNNNNNETFFLIKRIEYNIIYRPNVVVLLFMPWRVYLFFCFVLFRFSISLMMTRMMMIRKGGTTTKQT